MPAVPTFAVDDGFWYQAPDHLALDVGAIVRVPLSGRRVRGFVVETAMRPPERLKPVVARSGNAPVFDSGLLDSLNWAARHYVAPLSAVLERAAPPNNPTLRGAAVDVNRSTPKRTRPTVLVRRLPDAAAIAAMAAESLTAGLSVMVVVPTAAEVSALAPEGEHVVVVHGEMDGKTMTAAWGRGQRGPVLLIGTPRIAAWQVRSLGTAIVVDDARRALKDRQTPTIHVRDLLRARSMREGFHLVVTGPTPSVEAFGWGSEIAVEPGRPWGLVEIVDRRADAPGGGLLADTARRALQAVVSDGGSAFLFAHRRGHAAASRCIGCRRLRRCEVCGARLVAGGPCERCGEMAGRCPGCEGDRFEPLGSGVGRLVEEASRVVGRAGVGAFPAAVAVQVGTERDLVDVAPQDLVVMVDLDGLLFATNYRAAEEAMRIGARLAGKVKRGRRMIVQTQDPTHPVVVALAGGSPVPFLETEVDHRGRLGYPPAGQLMVMEARGPHEPGEIDANLRELSGTAMVMGPAAVRDGSRWLVQDRNLDRFKLELRALLRRLRDGGVTVRVDADPIDL